MPPCLGVIPVRAARVPDLYDQVVRAYAGQLEVLAPVVDIRSEVAPKGLERRTFGRDVETVIDLAGAFMRGMHAEGVAGRRREQVHDQ